jgi:hypothetical protein
MVALEERKPESVFELCDLFGESRLTDGQAMRGAGKFRSSARAIAASMSLISFRAIAIPSISSWDHAEDRRNEI